jgi:hypothetical protein
MNLMKHRHFFSDTAEPVLFRTPIDVSSPTEEALRYLKNKQKSKHCQITEKTSLSFWKFFYII